MQTKLMYSQAEEKTRKRWRLSFLVLLGWNWLIVLETLLVNQHRDLAIVNATVAAIWSVFSLLIYYCAYQKPGTRLLTWALWSPVLAWCNYLTKPNPQKLDFLIFGDLVSAEGVWETLLVLVPNGIYLWWYILSFQLRKINKAIACRQEIKLDASTEYQKVIAQMEAAETLKSLNTQFHHAIKNWPQFESDLSQRYSAKKADLEAT